MKKGALLVLFFCALAGLAVWINPEDPAASGKVEVDYPCQAEDAWEYPVRPGTEEWIALESLENRREACRVPQEALEAMDTAALLETALDYPFCLDMLAFDNAESGYRYQLTHNTALAALQERTDRQEVVQGRLEDMGAWLDEVGRTRSAGAALQYDYLLIFAQYME